MSFFHEVADQFLADANHQEPYPTLTDFLGMVSKTLDLLEARDLRHGIRIALITGAIAKAMGMRGRERMATIYAALVHDAGLAKVAYPIGARLLNHPQGFSSGILDEKRIFRAHTLLNLGVTEAELKIPPIPEDVQQLLWKHPMAAIPILDSLHLSEEIRELVGAHHELWDGSGRPNGLRRDEIPLGSRIIAFADAIEVTMAEVNGLLNRQRVIEAFLDSRLIQKFDPDVVKAFRSVAVDVLPEHTGGYNPFLSNLYSPKCEQLLNQMCAKRFAPVSGKLALQIAFTMSQLPDGLLPDYTASHSLNVAKLSAILAARLNIRRDQFGELIIAALLHDVGKLAIPVRVLMKNQPLSREEWALVHDHPRYTEMVLKDMPGFKNVIAWASEHHERMNGSGYYIGKKAHDISLAGRILALADTYDALTSRRPYREMAYEPQDAIPIIQQGQSRYFDTQLVNLLSSTAVATAVSAI